MTHYQLVRSNKTRTSFIIASFIIFVVGAVYAMSYAFGYGLDTVGLALIFAGLSAFVSYWWSDKIILGISGARPATRKEFFDFYTTVENLTISQQLPMPDLYVIEDTAMNAFATGRDPKHAVVCATTGLLNRLKRSEIEAVMAHELSHIKNYDIRLMSIVTVLVGMVSLLADWMLRMTRFGRSRKKNSKRESSGGQLRLILFIAGILLALLSPLIAQLMKLALSRGREFLADASAAAMTKNPEGLARALEKISSDQEPLEAANKATAHLYIANPLNNAFNGIGIFAQLFNTHPPVAERIERLHSL
jgi:heat shock protein HtpX